MPATRERGCSVRRQGGEESARQVGLRVLTGHGTRRRGGAQGGAGRALAWAECGSPHDSRTARRGPNFEATGCGVGWALARAGPERGLDVGGGAPSRGWKDEDGRQILLGWGSRRRGIRRSGPRARHARRAALWHLAHCVTKSTTTDILRRATHKKCNLRHAYVSRVARTFESLRPCTSGAVAAASLRAIGGHVELVADDEPRTSPEARTVNCSLRTRRRVCQHDPFVIKGLPSGRR